MAIEFNSADLVRITGMKPRWVQALAEKGIIHPEPETDKAGTGVPRRFSQAEAIVACVVATFARRKMTVGALQRVATNLRSKLRKEGMAGHILDVIREGEPAWLVVSWGLLLEFHYIVKTADPTKGRLFSDVFGSLEHSEDGVAEVIYLTKILKDVV
ncbi:hypothetical protein [Mesorhizobium sp. B2-6-5]|uniref:hypothetical protein n=1 Tax=Mesorhizobium sp. B2-6-5 TaxID=2589912 RepID=UPI0011293C18|nr:hypothetical protein [Mesorhizobium sp. B2-6-5]TPJ34251.1 hypothetical protein FJ432_29965 [Mesorhizobium sp. B2-6-5]